MSASTLGLALGVAALAGCATPAPPAAVAPWIQGRLSVKVEALADQAERSETAAFELRGGTDRGELRLSTPLGSLVAVAAWAPGLVTLTTPQGRYHFDTLAELARRSLGEELPLQALPDWLQARPWPEAPHRADGSGSGFEQLGWRIDLTRFTDGLLVAQRDAAPAVTLRVRLER